MSIRKLLLPLFVVSLLLTSVGCADDSDSAPPAPGSDGARVELGGDEDDGPPPTLTLAQFKKAVAKVQMPCFQRLPELAAGGGLGLILVGDNDNGLTIMGLGQRTGEQFEKGAAGKLSRFKHKGHEALFAQMTDGDGEEMAFIVVQYPEHQMTLLITGKPVTSRAELMKLLAQVEL